MVALKGQGLGGGGGGLGEGGGVSKGMQYVLMLLV